LAGIHDPHTVQAVSSNAATSPSRSALDPARHMTLGLTLLALAYLGPALWIVVDPHGFFEQVGPFGAYNPHYLGDAAAFQGGIGAALAASLRWPALRAGALASAFAATALHAINHWIDVGDAHAGSSAGIVDAVSLTLLALLIAGLLHASLRERAA
jgi:hypothetical protein